MPGTCLPGVRWWLSVCLNALLRLIALLALLAVLHPASAQSLAAIPPLSARVTDLSATLSQDQRDALERKLAAFEQDWGSQILVLLLPSTQPEDIAAYANRAFNQWKPGRAGIGDGLLVVVAVQDRRMRIEVGRALEGAVPDLAAKRIIDAQMAPAFRRGDFYTGLDLATDQLMQRLRGETPPPATSAAPAAEDWRWLDLGIMLLIVFPMVGSLTRRILGHKPGSLASGLIVAALIHSFTSSLLLAALGGLLALLLTYLAGTALGQAIIATQRPHNTHGGWGDGGWSGGTGGGFGGGGSGGGFSSGGGGDGAGGGASGGW